MKKQKPRRIKVRTNSTTSKDMGQEGIVKGTTPPAQERGFAIFAVGNEWYGVDMDSIFEILHDYEITPISHLPIFYEGSIKFRGETIPVIKLRELLNLEPGNSDSQVCVICESNGAKTGILIDSEIEFVKSSDIRFFALPDCYNPDEEKFLEGIIAHDKRLIGILRIDQVSKVLFERRSNHEDK